MGSETDLGKGIFGYRKNAVNQIIADRDQMLRQAEGRVRAAESKVADLETELNSMRDRNTRMDEQLERLRSQLDTVMERTQGAAPAGGWSPPQTDTHPEPSAEAHSVPVVPEEPAHQMQSFEDVPVVTEDHPAEGTPPGDSDFEIPSVAIDLEAGFETPVAEGTEQFDVESTGAPEESLAWESAGSWSEAESSMQSFDRYEVDDVEGTSPAQDADVPETDLEFDQFAYVEPSPSEEPASVAAAGDETWQGMTTSEEDAPFDISSDDPGWNFEATVESEPTADAFPIAEYEVEAPEAEAEGAPFTEDEYAELEPEPEQPVAERSVEAVTPRVDDLTARFLNDELAAILRAAEESASRIVERARTTTHHELEESNRLWREVQAEVARFAAWREEVEPVIHSVQSKVESVRGYIDEVPERIREALAPVAESISSIDADLADLASRATPPLLLTPSGVRSSEGEFRLPGTSFEAEADAETAHAEDESEVEWPIDQPEVDIDVEFDTPAYDQSYELGYSEGWQEEDTPHPATEGEDTFGASAG
jgi:hypothetical protein